MSMSKKDYEAVAGFASQRISEHEGNPAEQAAIEQLVWDLAAYFAASNPAFTKVRFLKAAIPHVN